MIRKDRRKPKKQIQDPVPKSPGTELVAITNNVVPTKKSEFEGFPLDIINMLFEHYWSEMSYLPSSVLPLHVEPAGVSSKESRGRDLSNSVKGKVAPSMNNVLSGWLKPGSAQVSVVLAVIVGSKEKNLDDRWKDYQTLTSREDVTHRLIHHVPKPFSVSADEWFLLAAQQLKIQFLTWEPSAIGNTSLYKCFRRSRLYQWLLSSSEDKWLLLNRKYGKTKRSHHALMAGLLYFPDEAQSWHTPRRS
ncbi:hypothetical protein BOTNAR_0852g00010 [Botryotinia narcissicola]|uniref:Uncharacterized protein n=1 Tax=Botryotinia narcissicola TaxID=278944 RepID=A0A4Z1H697_9HELO|nr:hypothetical protein BOTNAR_0852g00010 [Botryotinia narcissicola]